MTAAPTAESLVAGMEPPLIDERFAAADINRKSGWTIVQKYNYLLAAATARCCSSATVQYAAAHAATSPIRAAVVELSGVPD